MQIWVLHYGLVVFSALFCLGSVEGFSFSLPFFKHHKPSSHSDTSNLSPPIDSTFRLPSPLPAFPQGTGFASGTVDLGGLQVTKITSFRKIWATQEGGPDNLGATIYEPSSTPEGFFSLGSYAQPNTKPLHGYLLVAKDLANGVLKNPTDYTLIWSSNSLPLKQDTSVYIWLPTPPEGYNAMGHVITLSPEKPPLDRIRCVRADFSDTCQASRWIWGSDGLNFYSTKPTDVGVQDMGFPLGTFTTTNQSGLISITSCLKNAKANFSYMPNLAQVQALVEAYSPFIHLHPDEEYRPSTVNWFFENGGLLYKQGNESNPVMIQTNGTNLPLDGSNDGSYWLDLPINGEDKERVKKGDLQNATGYLHIKPMLGATFTDIAVWLFYPFNGAARAKLGSIKTVSLGKIGEHVGDWEHMTLRISNFDGELQSVYFSQHSKGVWVESPDLEFRNGNRVVGYASLHGHAFYPKAGVVLQGGKVVGVRDDAAESDLVVDVAARWEVVAAHYELGVAQPPWVRYMGKWGPKITYDAGEEMEKVVRWFPGKLEAEVRDAVSSLPPEVLGEEGPTGPKVKTNWYGDEA